MVVEFHLSLYSYYEKSKTNFYFKSSCCHLLNLGIHNAEFVSEQDIVKNSRKVNLSLSSYKTHVGHHKITDESKLCKTFPFFLPCLS